MIKDVKKTLYKNMFISSNTTSFERLCDVQNTSKRHMKNMKKSVYLHIQHLSNVFVIKDVKKTLYEQVSGHFKDELMIMMKKDES